MGEIVGKSIISLDDLSIQEIETIFETTDHIRKNWKDYQHSATGLIAASLFHEPSTRTRLSFDAAMQRLGGGTISTAEADSSSAAKGESLADTVRVVGSYADILIIRHPWEGAARLASEYSPVPIINAGDGRHEHPTQTLCDLYTLREHHGSLKGLRVALCGDLLNGRTIHSLAFALARFGANIIFVPGEGNDIPDYVLRRLESDYNAHIRREQLGVLSALFNPPHENNNAETVNAIYITPRDSHQLAMSTIEGTTMRFEVSSGEALSIYVTRRQSERESSPSSGKMYPKMTLEALQSSEFKDISILHPLPRVDELSPKIDNDPRSLYFKQATLGVPVRMSLICHVLGLRVDETEERASSNHPSQAKVLYSYPTIACSNPTCVTNMESQFAKSAFEIVSDNGYHLACLYCDCETPATYAGNISSSIYYPSYLLDRILPSVLPEHVRFFSSDELAELHGYRYISGNWGKYDQAKDRSIRSWLASARKNLP